MVLVVPVDDPADPRIADYVGLKDADLRRRDGAAASDTAGGTLIAEGVGVIRRLLASPYPVRSLLLTGPRLAALEPDLAGVAAPVYLAEREVIRATVGFDLHRGAVAAAARLPLPSPSDVLAQATTVAVLEGLNDHENLGAIARSAAGLGVDALLLDPTCADPLYRRAVRVSMGEILHLPFTRVAPWPSALAELRDAGFRLLALTPDAAATPIDAVDPPGRLALLLGTEGPGLSEAAIAAADERVCIPLRAGVDSLNVGHAAAIAFHRFGRRGR
jgi:tRNA G18 (ribose-2'-O)-methylase SpoU